jgi:hypothetical protein
MNQRKMSMSFVKYVLSLVFIMVLAACGGGGGDPGSPSGGSTTPGTGTPAVAVPTMTLTVVDGVGSEITNHVLSQTQAQFLKVVLKDGKGAAVPFARVTVTLDSTSAVLVPATGTQLTDASGVVLMRIAPANVNSSGTVLASAAATVGAFVIPPQTYDFQITPGTVSLSAVSVTPASVQRGQSVNVSVDVIINGAAAASNSVAVTFSTSCGTVSPASALVNSAGRASAVIQTTSTGSCTVDASASGITTSPAPYTVTVPPTTGLQFVSSSPSLIYQTGSAGVNTSIVTFKVIDSLAAGVQGVAVNASLTNTDGGINFCGSPTTGLSSVDGTVTFSICAGTLPATVQVRAELATTPTVFTNSNLLTVQTGLPTQRFFDVSATQFNFYAGGYFTSGFNGNNTTISVFAADRQGNPVPNGTKVIFVSEGGQINSAGASSCLIANGRCSVDLIGQDYRPLGSSAPGGEPRPGRVTVLAYADGEESFVDANFNNRYDKAGDIVNGVRVTTDELFEDLGTLYMDKDESGLFLAAYTNLQTGTNEGEFAYPMPVGSTGTFACPANSAIGLSVASTCNRRWDGLTKVRRQIVIVFSGGEVGQPGDFNALTNPGGYDKSIPVDKRTATLSATRSAVSVRLADRNGNPLPATAGVSTEVIPATGTCKAVLAGAQIGNTTEPTIHTAFLDQCGGGELIRFKVTVAGGSGSIESSHEVTVPKPVADTTAPAFTAQGAPSVESITSTNALFTAAIDEAGTGYYRVQLASEAAPSVFAVTFQGNAIGMAGNTQAGAVLSSLIANTSYTVYFVARDAAGNTQSAVTPVNFTTP